MSRRTARHKRCSQYNPIERRVIPFVTRTCQGVVFESVKLVEDLISRTRTQAGLSVTISTLNRIFEIGRKVPADVHTTCRIIHDELPPNGTSKPCQSLAQIVKSLKPRSFVICNISQELESNTAHQVQ